MALALLFDAVRAGTVDAVDKVLARVRSRIVDGETSVCVAWDGGFGRRAYNDSTSIEDRARVIHALLELGCDVFKEPGGQGIRVSRAKGERGVVTEPPPLPPGASYR